MNSDFRRKFEEGCCVCHRLINPMYECPMECLFFCEEHFDEGAHVMWNKIEKR